MCVGCVKLLIHEAPKGQTFKGQGHKAKWKLCTETSNICRKRHPIVEIYPSYRKSRSPERMAWSDCSPEAI